MDNTSHRTEYQPITRERLKNLAVSDTGFIFDPQTGQSFTVNQTGLVVLGELKKGSSVDKASTILADVCEVPYEQASSSVESFLMQLGRYL